MRPMHVETSPDRRDIPRTDQNANGESTAKPIPRFLLMRRAPHA
jgi:hypothetical protein